jgi:hypothetical protein
MPLLATACWYVPPSPSTGGIRARHMFPVVALPMQVMLALGLTSVWDIHQYTSPMVGLAEFLSRWQ